MSIRTKTEGGVATITLADPDVRNAITGEDTIEASI